MVNWTPFLIGVCLLNVFTGSINTISTKWADVTTGVEGIDGQHRDYNHPFVQACGMFFGEFLCLVAFLISQQVRRSQGKPVESAKPGFNPLLFCIPACCDLTGTSLMYIGLGLTSASLFQMLRGSVVIYTGILSVVFLKRKLYLHHWAGMVFVLIGLLVVGLASMLHSGNGSASQGTNPLLGNIIIVIAQLIVAIQMVVEEKLLGKYQVPALQAVGIEGTAGFCILGLLLIPFYYIPNPLPDTDYPKYAENSHGVVPLEHTPDAFSMLSHSGILVAATLGNVCSIAFFNFSGITVTKNVSATTRMVLDSVRTFTVWGFDLIVSWETFDYLQVIGFVLMLFGMALYYEVIHAALGKTPPGADDDAPEDEDGEKIRLVTDDVERNVQTPGSMVQYGGTKNVLTTTPRSEGTLTPNSHVI
eukprot:NODE_1234_length_1414_cov_53.941725_g1223_i0.p1 GENE.NODE_1234_length_1414_cov_53.941725_g1223_i0~~NODE_1234_length_1414_cov_53.941725_g1223_i0.p1  ORF type:complete len:417 (-),score=52.35 NODE_1234_length_1414_cov_53.941725_g1223_i0:61-1311(-)